MRGVKFVPADADARKANPLAELEIQDPARKVRRPKNGQIPFRALEKMAMARGWVRLSLLTQSERERWLDANRAAKAVAKATEKVSA